jgi:hypothetical protein
MPNGKVRVPGRILTHKVMAQSADFQVESADHVPADA